MSALTGNNVKDTYQGLLKLANSQTGVTAALQYVQNEYCSSYHFFTNASGERSTQI